MNNAIELLTRLRANLVRNGQSERGTTLIEMMVTIAIISIVSLGILYLMTALFNSSILGAQASAQQSTTGTSSSFVSSRISGSTSIGELEGGDISGVSIAGDQFVVQNSNSCIRLFYSLHSISTGEGQLRYAAAPTCDSIKAVRGPNETVSPHNGCPAPCYQAQPGDDNYDPVLDDPDKSFALIDFASLPDGGNAIGYNNQPFTYMDSDNHAIGWFAPRADSSNGSLATTWASQVNSIKISVGVRAVAENSTPSVSPRLWTQQAFLAG